MTGLIAIGPWQALPLLQARRGPPLEMLVCDMNAPPAEVVSVALYALPLMAAGAVLVLTFKNPFPKRLEWHAALQEALSDLGTFADDVQVVHLLANTTKETTVVARVAASAAGRAPGSEGLGGTAALSSHLAVATGRAATAAEAAEARALLAAARARVSNEGSTILAKPRSKFERAAMAGVHARVAAAFLRARVIARGEVES